MIWLLYAAISVFSLSLSNILKRVLMKDQKSDPIISSIVFQLLCMLLVGIYAFARGFIMPPVAEMPVNFLISAIFYGLGNIFTFKALKSIESSEFSIITTLQVIVAILASVLFLDENFSAVKGIGTVLVLIAVFLVIEKTQKLSFKRGSLYALGVAICYGIAIPNDAYILRFSDVVSYTALMFLLPSIVMIILNLNHLSKSLKINKSLFSPQMLILGILFSISAVTFYSALERGANASQLVPINQSTSIVITILLATVFLKERDRLPVKLISGVLLVIGVMLLT